MRAMVHARFALWASLLGCGWAQASPTAPRPASKDILRVTAGESLKPFAPAMALLMREAGLTMELSFLPLSRSLLMLQRGEVDGEFARQEQAVAAFREDVRLIGPLGCITLRAYVREAHPGQAPGPSALDGQQIGVASGYRFATETLEARKLPFKAVVDHDALMKMLVINRLDVVVADEATARATLHRLGLTGQVRALAAPLASRATYFVLRRQLDHWGPRLERAAASLISSGRWQRLVGELNVSQGLPQDFGVTCLNTPRAVRAG